MLFLVKTNLGLRTHKNIWLYFLKIMIALLGHWFGRRQRYKFFQRSKNDHGCWYMVKLYKFLSGIPNKLYFIHILIWFYFSLVYSIMKKSIHLHFFIVKLLKNNDWNIQKIKLYNNSSKKITNHGSYVKICELSHLHNS